MGVDINWNLLRPSDPGAAFAQGYENGQAQRRERDLRKGIQAYAENPNDQTYNALMPLASPDQAMGMIAQRQKQQAQQQAENQAALGKAIGQAVLDVMQQPPEQRAARWDAYVDQFARTNPSAAQYRGQYSDQAAMAILAQQGLTQDWQASQQPKYMAIPEGGTLVNTRDPSAVAQFGAPSTGGGMARPQPQMQPQSSGSFLTPDQARAVGQGTNFLQWQQRHGVPVLVDSPQAAASLPAGTLMITPDGRKGVKR